MINKQLQEEVQRIVDNCAVCHIPYVTPANIDAIVDTVSAQLAIHTKGVKLMQLSKDEFALKYDTSRMPSIKQWLSDGHIVRVYITKDADIVNLSSELGYEAFWNKNLKLERLYVVDVLEVLN